MLVFCGKLQAWQNDRETEEKFLQPLTALCKPPILNVNLIYTLPLTVERLERQAMKSVCGLMFRLNPHPQT